MNFGEAGELRGGRELFAVGPWDGGAEKSSERISGQVWGLVEKKMPAERSEVSKRKRGNWDKKELMGAGMNLCKLKTRLSQCAAGSVHKYLADVDWPKREKKGD